jgi:cytoskeletal protein CcmA (bactofilin family)
VKTESGDFSIFDRQLSVQGEVVTEGRLIVKGTLRGVLRGDTVIVAVEGVVQAETTVRRMTIGGRFEGRLVVSEDLVILATGVCAGQVTCRHFSVEAGGVLNAEVTCNAGQEQAPASAAQERPAPGG